MKIVFTKNGWEDYTSWLLIERKKLKRINELIEDIKTNPYVDIGKPEKLKYDLAGYWSRRIDEEHRLVYKIFESDLLILSCKYHYD